MAKGKKILVSILIVLLVLVLVAVIVFNVYGDQLVRTAIVAGAQKALQVDVRLESVDLQILAGKTELTNLEIDNPEGYKHPTFLKLGRTYVELDTSSILSDTVEIPLMQLDNIAVVIEQKGTTSNISKILDNLPKSESAEGKPEPAETGGGKNVRIKVLEINNIEVKAKLLPVPGRADTVTLKVKPIRMENVGSDEKIDIPGLTAKIITAIAKGIAQQGTDMIPTEMLGSAAKQLGKQGGALIMGGVDVGKGAAESATDAVKGLGGLLPKKEKEPEP